jgi:hypothetical protein
MVTDGCQTEGCSCPTPGCIDQAVNKYDKARAYSLACQNGTGSDCPDAVGIAAFTAGGLVTVGAAPPIIAAASSFFETVSTGIGAYCAAYSQVCAGLLTGAQEAERQAPSAADIVKQVPTMGRAGSDGVRELVGTTVDDAQALFKSLTINAIDIETKDNGAVVAELSDGTYITFRATSSVRLSDGVPTIDINSPTIGYWKLKFIP